MCSLTVSSSTYLFRLPADCCAEPADPAASCPSSPTTPVGAAQRSALAAGFPKNLRSAPPLSPPPAEHWNIKVTDFGLVKTIMRDVKTAAERSKTGEDPRDQPGFQEYYELTGGTGSYKYMAPEVFLSLPANEKVDQYSYAICIWELVARKPLLFHRFRKSAQGGKVEYTPKTWAEEAARGKRAELPSAWPNVIRCRALPAREPATQPLATPRCLCHRRAHRRALSPLSACPVPSRRRLIKDCWDHNPENRPSYKQLMVRRSTLGPPPQRDEEVRGIPARSTLDPRLPFRRCAPACPLAGHPDPDPAQGHVDRPDRGVPAGV